ncbi:hypothetical protein AB0J38_06395 [Streptomyces sp. NPDC050095]|uniref:glycosyltransferase family protein n=1 Tax=unclassified Streptomyces TaxID=2593676 RepID=UPI00342A66F0
MSHPPVVLHLTNDLDTSGFARGFDALRAEGALRHVPLSPPALLRDGATKEEALRTLTRRAREAAPDLVLVRSPHGFPWDHADVAAFLKALGSPPVVQWEGDAWGGRKPLTDRTAAWLRHADSVFSVALGEQAALFGEFTREPVRYVPNTLPDRLRTPDPVPPLADARYDAVHIGGCYVRFGVLERVDDARKRRNAVRRVLRLHGVRTVVHGPGWRGRSALGPLPFDQQVAAVREARLSFDSGHFLRHPGYTSNRMAIGLYAGRPLVTSRIHGASWLPGPALGLHQADSPKGIAATVRALLRDDPDTLHAAGLAGHRWVRDRLGNEQALRHMLGAHLPVAPPPADPWQAFA